MLREFIVMLFNLGGDSFSEDQGEITSILQRAHQSRRAAENVCKHTISKLDKLFGLAPGRHSPVRPWEDLSGTSKARYVLVVFPI